MEARVDKGKEKRARERERKELIAEIEAAKILVVLNSTTSEREINRAVSRLNDRPREILPSGRKAAAAKESRQFRVLPRTAVVSLPVLDLLVESWEWRNKPLK